jgi:hypothetical protein
METQKFEVYRKATTFYYDTVYAATAEEAYNKTYNLITEENPQSEYVEFSDHYEIINPETGNLIGVANKEGFSTVENFEDTSSLETFIEKLIAQPKSLPNSETLFVEGFIQALEKVKTFVKNHN